jgi:acyl carrier protein
MSTEQKLKRVLSETFHVSEEKITPDTRQSELENWDSLGQLRLIMEIESAFDISFSMEEVVELNSFEKILERVQYMLSK